MNIVLLARSLGLGGAERQLAIMAREMSRRHRVTVMTFYGSEADHFTQAELGDARLLHLGKRGRWDLLPFATRFVRQLRQIRPDVVYAFMGPPSIVALLSRLGCRGTRVVWGVRSSNVDLSHYGLLARLVRRAECRLSRFADLIISNSVAGRDQAASEGFDTRRMTVIGNAIDTTVFHRRPASRDELRRTLGLAAETPLVGIVARMDPMKGHEVFLHAAATLSAERPDVHFVIGGHGPADRVERLRQLAARLGLDGRMHWLGRVDDVVHVYSALDLCTSSSVFGEGFSNSVGEAMACETPCVVTDVGDSARIVGDTGRAVPANDPDRLARCWAELLALPPADLRALGARARHRVVSQFGLSNLIDRTEAALADLGLPCASP